MIFSLSFYIFSILLSYTDLIVYKIPNITISALFSFLIIFGLLEEKLNLFSLLISLAVLFFFIIILFLMPKSILGGGDIKYMILIAIFLEPRVFPYFLVIAGFIQVLFLLYFQKIKKRLVSPMAPAMFLAVIITEIVNILYL